MLTDPTCRLCSKSCKQVQPAIVIYCAKFIPIKENTEKDTEKMTG